MQSASISFTIATTTYATYTPSVSTSPVTTLNFNSPTGGEAFYVRFTLLDLGPGNDFAYAIDFKSSAGVYNIIIGGATV
jgi:hypothetical protein